MPEAWRYYRMMNAHILHLKHIWNRAESLSNRNVCSMEYSGLVSQGATNGHANNENNDIPFGRYVCAYNERRSVLHRLIYFQQVTPIDLPPDSWGWMTLQNFRW